MNFYQRDKSISEPSKPLNQRVREGLLWGGLGNFVQQFVSLLLGIALSRILNPDDYGMTAMLTLFSLLAATIQESGFGTALANRKVILFKEYNSVFWFSACLSISLYLLLYFLAPRIASFYATPDLVPLSRYMFLGFLIGGLGVAPNAYLFRQQQVRERSLASSIAVIFSGLVGVLLAFLGFGYWSLASQYIVYSAVVTLMLWYFSGFRPSLGFDYKSIVNLYRFSFKVLLANIVSHVNNYLFSLFIGRFYGKEYLGYFTQGHKWSNMGQSVVSNVSHGFTQPMFSGLSDQRERQRRIFRKLLRFIAFISFPCLFGLALISNEFVSLVITDKWKASVPILQVLCVSASFSVLVNLYSNFILSHGRSGLQLALVLSFGLGQLIVILLSYSYGLLSITRGIAICQILWFFIWKYYAARLLQIRYVELLKDFSLFLFIAASATAISYCVGSFVCSLWGKMFSKVIILVLLYGGATLSLKAEPAYESLGYIKSIISKFNKKWKI